LARPLNLRRVDPGSQAEDAGEARSAYIAVEIDGVIVRVGSGADAKVIYWDGTGVCLFAERLEDGKCRWPNVQDGVIRLSAAQLSALLEGWIGDGFTRCGRHRRRCSRDDCGRVNQGGARARGHPSPSAAFLNRFISRSVM
jgi:transposase